MNNHKMWNRKSIILIFSLLLLVVLVLGWLEKTQLQESEELEAQLGVKPSAPMYVNLSLTGTPSLNQPVELTFTVTPLTDAPNTLIQVMLPEGFSLISGNLSWNGDIAKNETIQIRSTVKAVEAGYWAIEAYAKSMRFGFGKRSMLFINVSETTATVSKSPLQDYSRSNRTMVGELPPDSNLTYELGQ
ncbi:MAG: hypothetical protein HYW26_00020 [Candidatus Aenigmarchaeota archaeon]|nr:hypothetical protein [Candidatus Aenigmarchaeota archaeon]